LDEGLLVLVADHPEYAYEVALEECASSAEMLDWIMQVANKTWADDEVVAGLVRALNEVLRPQGTLCANGLSTTLSKEDIGRIVRRQP